MKALQRLVVTGHWLALLWAVAVIVTAPHNWFEYGGHFYVSDIAISILFNFGPLAALVFVLWFFTGKFILWPWKRSLPKQEN